ncbi:MAG: 50S ribosomal protein L13 [Chloroflexi bacterium]|nr:50S ribosomal protein L13 [Chloroflexota bacterium]
MNNTYATKESDIERKWHVIDATDKVLGRLTTQIAKLLMGKHKPIYAPNLDTGDYVVVINAAKVRVTGNKTRQKLYIHHTPYPGGLKVTNFENQLEADPSKVIESAVRGMLPHTKLGNAMRKKLKVYAGAEHPHLAQTARETAEAKK